MNATRRRIVRALGGCVLSLLTGCGGKDTGLTPPRVETSPVTFPPTPTPPEHTPSPTAGDTCQRTPLPAIRDSFQLVDVEYEYTIVAEVDPTADRIVVRLRNTGEYEEVLSLELTLAFLTQDGAVFHRMLLSTVEVPRPGTAVEFDSRIATGVDTGELARRMSAAVSNERYEMTIQDFSCYD